MSPNQTMRGGMAQNGGKGTNLRLNSLLDPTTELLEAGL